VQYESYVPHCISASNSAFGPFFTQDLGNRSRQMQITSSVVNLTSQNELCTMKSHLYWILPEFFITFLSLPQFSSFHLRIFFGVPVLPQPVAASFASSAESMQMGSGLFPLITCNLRKLSGSRVEL
jgi:hypothetical protein